MKKKFLIVANCFAWEYHRHLCHYDFITSQFQFEVFTTYVQKPNVNFFNALKSADVVLCQNVKSIIEYSPEFIRANVKKEGVVIVTEFWRFDGYWPYKSTLERKCPYFWFPVDEFGQDLSFHDYINFPLVRSEVVCHYESELEKLRQLDNNSDIRIFDFILSGMNSNRLFSDHWHPMPQIICYVLNRVFEILSIDFTFSPLLPVGINNNRHRLILHSVKEFLNVGFPDEKFYFLGKLLSSEQYFDFSVFLRKKGLETITSFKDLEDNFSTFFDF